MYGCEGGVWVALGGCAGGGRVLRGVRGKFFRRVALGWEVVVWSRGEEAAGRPDAAHCYNLHNNSCHFVLFSQFHVFHFFPGRQ